MPDPASSLLISALIAVISYFLFWPERGIIPRWRRTREMTERVLSEDALKHIHKCERYGRKPTVESIAGALNVSRDRTADILTKMEAHDSLKVTGEGIQLTSAGRDYALRIIRAHRLYERYLAYETGFSSSEWHDQADRYEHMLSPEQTNALSSQLGNPTHDPHGDPIPTASGEFIAHGGQPLPSIDIDQPVRIVHIEDEPEAVYAQIVAVGLHPGMELEIVETTQNRIRFWAGGNEHILAPIVAANISVVPIPTRLEVYESAGEKLFSLTPGEMGEVVSISPLIRGPERRRLMDLGILPGTVIESQMKSPGGDPTAYIIRGAVIALRSEQAKLINITRMEGSLT